MARQAIKFVGLLALTLVLGLVANTFLGYVDTEWTRASLRQVSNNMGDQVAIKAQMNMWNIIRMLSWAAAVLVVAAPWLLGYRRQLKQLVAPALALMLLPLMTTGCSTSYNTVIVTPPNYAIVVNLNSPSNQATGNNFGNGELLNVSQVVVEQKRCEGGVWQANDYCPDKLVAQVPGAPESRIYTKDKDSGTAGTNQALCFEAQGTNGCLNFSVTAIVLRDNAMCYANKMGVTADKAEDGTISRYSYHAKSLGDALDTRVLQIAGAEFAKVTANQSPLDLALMKFGLFEESKPKIKKAVEEATCITIQDLGINGGIVWDSQGVQDTIDQATIVKNRIELAGRENEVADIQAAGVISRTEAISKMFGVDAAVELQRIMKWNGSYLTLPGVQGPMTNTVR